MVKLTTENHTNKMNIKILLLIPILIGSSVWSSAMVQSIAQDKCYGPAYPDSGICARYFK